MKRVNLEEDDEREFFHRHERRIERNVHRLRVLIHCFSVLLTLITWLLVGEKLELMLNVTFVLLPLVAGVDLLVIIADKKDRYLNWIKYVVTISDIIYLSGVIFSIYMVLGDLYFEVFIQVPAFTAFFFIQVLSGFRFNRLSTMCTGCLIMAVIFLMMLYDTVFAGNNDIIWIFSYLTVISIMFFTILVTVFISSHAKFILTENYRRLQEKRFVTGIFGRYVSSEVANEVLSGKLSLGGEEKVISVVFCDIRNFTSLSERLSPAEVVGLLNKFFSYLTISVTKYNGIVDKMIGDALMSIFGAPIENPDYAVNAVNTAIDMQKQLEKLNAELDLEGMLPLKIGVGIATGPVIIGNVGTDERMDYTAIGDTVNKASRLEGLCKEYNTGIIIDDTTYEYVKGVYDCKCLGEVTVRGRKEFFSVYTL